MTPTQRLDRARLARELTDNKLLQEVTKKLQEDAIARWRSSGMLDTDAREQAYLTMRAVDAFKSELARYIADAEIARRDIEQQT